MGLSGSYSPSQRVTELERRVVVQVSCGASTALILLADGSVRYFVRTQTGRQVVQISTDAAGPIKEVACTDECSLLLTRTGKYAQNLFLHLFCFICVTISI